MKNQNNIKTVIGVLCGIGLGLLLCLICVKMNSVVILLIMGFVISALGYYAATSFSNTPAWILALLISGGVVCVGSVPLNILYPQETSYYSQNISQETYVPDSPYSQEQFNQIAKGMTYAEVVAIIGEEGTKESEYNYPEYTSEIYYWGDFASGYMDITLIDGQVWHKYQYHLQ